MVCGKSKFLVRYENYLDDYKKSYRVKVSNVFKNNLFIEKSLPKKEIPSVLSAAKIASALFIDKPEMRLVMWQKPIEQVAWELDQKMHDEEWLKQASQAAMKLAEECFDRDILANKLIAVLQATVEGKPQRAAKKAP